MLADYLDRIKTGVGERKEDLLVTALVIVVAVGSFGLGRLSAIWAPKEPVKIITPDKALAEQARATPTSSAPTVKSAADSPAGLNVAIPTVSGAASLFIASKLGSAYHLLDCPGAKNIKEENKIYFSSREAAERAGYRPAGNCSGLK